MFSSIKGIRFLHGSQDGRFIHIKHHTGKNFKSFAAIDLIVIFLSAPFQATSNWPREKKEVSLIVLLAVLVYRKTNREPTEFKAFIMVVVAMLLLVTM